MSAQLALELDHEDIQRLGYIERRPMPGRTPGIPVGYDDRGMPIYRPVWADYEWFATWVSAADIDAHRYARYRHLRHCCLVGSWSTDDWLRMTTEQQADARDQRAHDMEYLTPDGVWGNAPGVPLHVVEAALKLYPATDPTSVTHA